MKDSYQIIPMISDDVHIILLAFGTTIIKIFIDCL